VANDTRLTASGEEPYSLAIIPAPGNQGLSQSSDAVQEVAVLHASFLVAPGVNPSQSRQSSQFSSNISHSLSLSCSSAPLSGDEITTMIGE
jgi:hypothetical protein